MKYLSAAGRYLPLIAIFVGGLIVGSWGTDLTRKPLVTHEEKHQDSFKFDMRQDSKSLEHISVHHVTPTVATNRKIRRYHPPAPGCPDRPPALAEEEEITTNTGNGYHGIKKDKAHEQHLLSMGEALSLSHIKHTETPRALPRWGADVMVGTPLAEHKLLIGIAGRYRLGPFNVGLTATAPPKDLKLKNVQVFATFGGAW